MCASFTLCRNLISLVSAREGPLTSSSGEGKTEKKKFPGVEFLIGMRRPDWEDGQQCWGYITSATPGILWSILVVV